MPYALYRAVLYVGINYLGKGLVGRGAWTREPGKYPWEKKVILITFFCLTKHFGKILFNFAFSWITVIFLTCVTMGLRGGDDDG